MTGLTTPDAPDRATTATPPPSPPPGPPADDTPGRLRRIIEEEYILVVLLAGFGLIFLLIFPPAIIVNDSWMTLMSGREVWEHGLPSTDQLTIYGLGSTWTDQQWLAQILAYGAYSLGGYATLSILTATSVVAAFSVAAAASRSLGAGARAIWILFLPVLMAAPWGWSVRAQMLALPLYTGLLWLLASQVRRPTNRVWIALPILAVWANVHGSVALGALLVILLGVYELVRSRGSTWLRSGALIVLAPLALLVTPYSPAAIVRYYHLLLVDPPFAGRVTEWHWAEPAVNTMFFYALAAIVLALVVWGRRRLTLFDVAVLALTFVGAMTAIRGIVWFALACMVFAPVAIGHSLESRTPGPPRRSLNVAISAVLAAAVLAVGASLFFRGDSWYEEYWPDEVVETVRAEVRPGDRVFAPDRFSDWLLWNLPELRGRLAYDVRFELYDRAFFDRLAEYNGEAGDWKSFADGYRIVIVDETRRSHTADFLREPGARVVYRDDEITIVARPRD
jgi:hypothetical protein